MRHFGSAIASAVIAATFAPLLMADDGQNVSGGTAPAADPKAKAAKGKFTVTLKGGSLGDKSESFEFGIAREVDAAKEIAARLGLTAESRENTAKRTAANSLLLKGIKDMYSDRVYQGALKIANEGDGLAAVPDYMIREVFASLPAEVQDTERANMETIARADLAPKAKADKPATNNPMPSNPETPANASTGGDANVSTAQGTPYAAPANG